MEKSTKENKVDAFVENAGNLMNEVVDTVKDAVNNAADGTESFINEVKTSETYANVKADMTEVAEKAAAVGKSALNVAKAFIKSKTEK